MIAGVRKAFWLQLFPLLAGFMVLAAIIGARAWLIEGQRADNAAVMRASEFERRLSGVLSLLQEAETGKRGYLLTGDESYLAPNRTAEAALPAELQAIGQGVVDDPVQASRFATLQDLVAEKFAEMNDVIDLYRDNRAADALALVRTDAGRRSMGRIRDVIDVMRRAETDVLNARLQSSIEASRWLSLGSVAALLALAVVAAISISGARRRMLDMAAAHRELIATNQALSREMHEKEMAETRIRQMQKMEAVGQLTGGIAHDFNNMLAVIISAMNLIQRKVARGETDLQKFVDAAMDAATRAASLTARLLAFSRQQPLSPSVIDANRLIAGMSELLSRTLGETVQIETVLAGGLWRTHADASQLENAVLNLAVNGRDAMPGGGRLTIETANCHLDDRYAATNADVPAGQYVLVAVTDTGTGMPPEVVARAFDPFFTTKAVDKGTGLGLSQVFGFVKQTGGHVKIYSEPGHGTTVKIYLKRHFGEEVSDVEEERRAARAGRPEEAILVVEDDERVRALSVEALRELGYSVIHASDAASAMRKLDSHPDIVLLFTDIVMPEVNGRKLADQALQLRPGLKVLFTTGFTRNAVVHNGVLDHGVNFIAKPFTIEQLAAKVREVLDA
ncbi:MAG: CHASE3 domain-containing protein [Mesorhizobium sp.]|nr:CHASE3 domain-containing protein [Mesorhizobium sp.]